MGDFVHLTCGQCSLSWWSDPADHLGRLAVLLRRRRRRLGDPGGRALPRGVDRCPECLSTQVGPSAPTPVLVDLTAASTVIWLDGVPGKERDDVLARHKA